MFYVPMLLTNALFLFTAYLTGIQYVRLANKHMSGRIQLCLVVFCIVMMLVTSFYNRVDPWLSLVFFAMGVASVLLMRRQRRYLPRITPRI